MSTRVRSPTHQGLEAAIETEDELTKLMIEHKRMWNKRRGVLKRYPKVSLCKFGERRMEHSEVARAVICDTPDKLICWEPSKSGRSITNDE